MRQAAFSVVGLVAIGVGLAAPAVAGKNDIVFISRASGAKGVPAAAKTNNDQASIDGTGRFVAFRSDAKNLSGADNDNVSDIFVRDAKAAKTILVSLATGRTGTRAEASRSSRRSRATAGTSRSPRSRTT